MSRSRQIPRILAQKGRKPAGARLGLSVGIVLLFGGCDPGSFVPPRPAELGGTETELAPATGATAPGAALVANEARAIELILGPPLTEDAEEVKKIARSQAGLEGIRIHIAVAGEKDALESTSALVQTAVAPTRVTSVLVGSAVARNPLALVLDEVHGTLPDPAPALADARGRGLPVVVIGGPESGLQREEAKGKSPGASDSPIKGPLIYVVPESFAPVAESLVVAAINNARNAKLTPKAGAVLIVNTTSDTLFEERAQALRGALKRAGIMEIEEVRFAGDLKIGKAKVLELLRSKRKPGIVLSTDHVGLTASYQDISDLGDERPYVVAAFTTDESGATMTRSGEFAAIAVFSPERLLRKAIATAASAGRGEKVADRVKVMIPIHVSPPDSATPKMYKPMQRAGRRSVRS
jgi:hypothetical protein